jgi:hypothetical protein
MRVVWAFKIKRGCSLEIVKLKKDFERLKEHPDFIPFILKTACPFLSVFYCTGNILLNLKPSSQKV